MESNEKSELTSRILHCDEACIVVNKIAGEAVEGAGKGMIDLPRQLVAAQLAAELSAAEWPAVHAKDALAQPTAVHRLDVPVSGCAVFARGNSALVFLNAAFSGYAAAKRYWAIVEPPEADAYNRWPQDDGMHELVHWIQFNPKLNKSSAHDDPGPGRKKAVLRCRQIGRGQNYLFLEIDLLTGRRHQIRAQLARMGLHIKGDLKYGARRSEKNGGIRLHARSISFPDPADSGKSIIVQADPPLRDNLWLAFEAFCGRTNAEG